MSVDAEFTKTPQQHISIKINTLKAYLGWLRDYYKTLNSSEQDQIQNSKLTSLSNLITHNKNIEIAEKVKENYKNIKGKRLKLLLMALQELKLIPEERMAKKFHESCVNEFEWHIASYNAMNGYSYNERTDEIELNQMKDFLNQIINNK